jgi:hypothetical protein
MATNREIAEAVRKDLAARKSGWEDKQRVWYEMRHEGIRRQNKPFPTAADLHFPMGDGMIDKLKPFYFAQVFGQQYIAEFISEQPQAEEMTRAAAAVFDYHLREETNFFEEILSAIDNLLMSGAAPVKVRWDTTRSRLEFDAIDPIFLVVPRTCTDIETADRVTHIRQMSVEQYKRQGEPYQTDDDTLSRIKGKGISENDAGAKQQEKYAREGITHGVDDDQIVLWEVFTREDDNTITVHTFAPCSPDTEVRPPFRLAAPYSDIPIVLFPLEIKDKGAYASRGIIERIAPHETYATRLWIEKADSMTFLNRPIFTHDGAALNLQNIRLTPGQIVPNNLRKVDMGQVPFDFDQELMSTRMIAEYQVGMPDFGTGQQINTKERKTATEVSAITNLMSQSTDLRAQIFRRNLGKLYRLAWSLLQHFAAEKLTSYYADNQVQQVDPQAVGGKYRIWPAGSSDGWNKQARQQRAAQRLQMYRGDASINQSALTRHALEEDDPRLVKSLWQDPGTAQADQIEDQADELSVLAMGFPASVHALDDHPTHVQTILGFVQAQQQLGRPLDPLLVKKLAEHAQQHVAKLGEIHARKQEANELGQQLEQAFAPLMPAVQAFEQQMAMQQQQQQMAQQAPGSQAGPMQQQLPSQQGIQP